MRKDTVAVVGLGYVGLPLACLLAESGLRTIGVDVDAKRVETLRSGVCPIVGKEPGLAELVSKVIANGKLDPTVNIKDAAECEAVFVCVDTPLGADRKPDLRILRSVVADLARILKKGMLVSIESTLPAGTCQNMIIPTLNTGSGLVAGADFHLVHCPERVMPGKLLNNMRTVSRVLGGLDSDSIRHGLYFYSRIVKAEIHPTDLLSAEICKTAENAYRDVQIAFANEIALICEDLGGNAFEVRRLVNTCPQRDMHIPGSGVGGHCLPKDSWLLISSTKAPARMMPSAREVNESMPVHLAEMALQHVGQMAPKNSRPKIAIMGLAFLRDSDDVRHSPALAIIDSLSEKADLVVHDPFVQKEYKVPLVRDMYEALQDADCALFVTDHSDYFNVDLERMKRSMRTAIIVDGRNIFESRSIVAKGFVYAGIGKG